MSTSANCPFCGKHNAAIDTFNYANGKPSKYRVQCRECLAATRWRDTAGEAWTAWERRKGVKADVNLVISKDMFILNGLLYSRNRLTGNCTAQKEIRGKQVRVKEEVFLEACEECVKITGNG